MSTNQTLLLPRWLLSMKPGEGVLTDQAVLLEGPDSLIFRARK